jgi:hypothetical protein
MNVMLQMEPDRKITGQLICPFAAFAKPAENKNAARDWAAFWEEV